MDNETIQGGAFQVARQLYSSEIWLKKPSSWKVIWIYILGRVNHTDNGSFKRGEGFFNLTEERKQIGIDITYDMIRHSMTYMRKCKMISTARSTRGVVIKVLNYDKYQSLDNFKKHKTKHKESTTEAQQKHNESTPISKNGNNVKNEKNVNIAKTSFAKNQINSILDIFYKFNPLTDYGNLTQRKAVQELIDKIGFDKLKGSVEYALKAQSDKYSPRITTPLQLKNKFGDLISYSQGTINKQTKVKTYDLRNLK